MYRRHSFARRYTRADLELLATVDEAQENLSGPATRRILERECRHYGKVEYERLASISVAPVYNLRRQPRYRERRLRYNKTRPTPVAIGDERIFPPPPSLHSFRLIQRLEKTTATIFRGGLRDCARDCPKVAFRGSFAVLI